MPLRRMLTVAVFAAVFAAAFAASPATAHAAAPDEDERVPQTSDGVRGEIARPIPPRLRGQRTTTTLEKWTVSPGVTYERFKVVDARGKVRGQLLRVNLATPGLTLDYAGGRYVASVAPLPEFLGPTAVAAVNGDFFDINDTGAPLGLGKDRERGNLHGREDGWNNALWADADGGWHIGAVEAKVRIVQHPRLHIPTVNAPSVREGGIGLYTRKWGVNRGTRVVDGQRKHVRMIVIRNRRVVANRTTFPKFLRVKGRLLVGRGAGAQELAGLQRGQRITTRIRMSGHPEVVLTGNARLLEDRRPLAIDDREMHPRTAVGIDEDTGQLLLLVIDGRQKFSRGYTMVELAKQMKRLGADDALNLDGGGSSTIMGLDPEGAMQVLNSPSDGAPRPIPNGLEVLYTPPPPA